MTSNRSFSSISIYISLNRYKQQWYDEKYYLTDLKNIEVDK